VSSKGGRELMEKLTGEQLFHLSREILPLKYSLNSVNNEIVLKSESTAVPQLFHAKNVNKEN